MSNLLVVTFENQEDGRKAHTELKNLKSEGGVNIQDVELVERDAEGKIHKVGKVDETTKAGIFGGGILGPADGHSSSSRCSGLAIGAVAGGLIGKSLGNDIDKQLVQDVVADLTPGTIGAVHARRRPGLSAGPVPAVQVQGLPDVARP